MILHIDMDAFFASVEQAINPHLKGQPLIVGSRNNKYHTVVCAASYEAKRLGIDSGMPSKEAFRLCPGARFIAADSAKYLYVSNQIFTMLKAYPGNLKYSSVDEFDLELKTNEKTGCLAIAKKIKQSIKNDLQITCSIGIAPSWQLAKIGSKIEKPDGLVFIDQDNFLEILSSLPIENVCGIGPVLTVQLNSLGIKTCGQLIRYPRQVLISKFGKVGSWLSECLRPDYQAIQEVNIPEIPKSIGHSYTLPKESSNPQIIQGWIRLLAEMVAQRLRKSGLEAHTICVWLNNAKNGGFSKQETFQTGIYQGIDIFLRARAILGLKNGKRISLRALGISVSGLKYRSQLALLNKEKADDFLVQATDRINHKYGDWTIYPAAVALIHKGKIAQR